jgi:hypothetical protein
MAFETTDRDRHRWQLRDARALVAMLEHGYREGLPPLHWSIGSIGGLVGEAHGLGSSVAEQRAAFDAWVDYLGARRWLERTDRDGVTHLHAQFTWGADDRVKGAIRADVFPTDHAAWGPQASGDALAADSADQPKDW